MVRFALCLFALSLSRSTAPAQTLLSAADVLDAVSASVPLTDARAVAVVPGAIKTRVVPGGWAGHGVLLVRDGDTWTDPAFVTLGGGVKLRPGDEQADLVLVFRTRRSLSRVVDGDGKIDAEVTAYGGRQFAEVALEGGTISKAGSLQRGLDRKHAEELKAKLAEATKPAPAAPPGENPARAQRPTGTVSDTRTLPPLQHLEAILGGIAAIVGGLAALRRRKR